MPVMSMLAASSDPNVARMGVVALAQFSELGSDSTMNLKRNMCAENHWKPLMSVATLFNTKSPMPHYTGVWQQ